MAQATPPRRIIKRDSWGLIGGPAIVLEFLPWETRVKVIGAAWGSPNADMTFLGGGRRSAERYANNIAADFDNQADARVRYRLGRKARNAAGRELGRMIDREERSR